jgi:hypothetical protein
MFVTNLLKIIQMEYIANIITKGKIKNSLFFNITSDFNNINKNIPTLIIGWEETKKLFPNQNILDNKINEHIYWTFSKREKRHKYESDMNSFLEEVLSFFNKSVNYHFFNYILSTEDKKNNFIKYINKGNCSIYKNSRFLYIYNSIDKITLGISLKDLYYIGVNIKEFIEKLNVNKNNLICENINFLDEESFFFIKDNIKSVAYLNYLKNNDIYIKKLKDNG